MKKNDIPEIAVVIIGINVSRYLSECIKSVLNSSYPQEKLNIIYVDGGSTDNSANIARKFKGVEVIELRDPHPTPGRGRNAGFRKSKESLVQFMDADTTLHPLWFEKALPFLKGKVAAVCGRRKERYPNKNVYHKIAKIEWNYEEGPCRYFGGEVIIRRDVIEQANGFDEKLVAGEDPDLSCRLSQNGWTIYRINEDMSTHDLNMNKFSQYIKRAYRTGHAYAEIGLRYSLKTEKLWLKELCRILSNALLPWLIIFSGILLGKAILGMIFAILIAFRPVWKFPRIKKKNNLTIKESILYTLHLSLVIYPQFAGILRYFYKIISGIPLQNKGLINIKE